MCVFCIGKCCCRVLEVSFHIAILEMFFLFPDSMPRVVASSISLPDSQLLDTSAANSASRWWSGIVHVPSAEIGSIAGLRFQCSGFDAKLDSLNVFGQSDASASAVLCGQLCATSSDAVCTVQGPSKVHMSWLAPLQYFQTQILPGSIILTRPTIAVFVAFALYYSTDFNRIQD